MFSDFCHQLRNVYDEREARNISKIVFEDVFHIYDAKSNKELDDDQLAQLNSIQSRLLDHEPVQYIIGHADFYGLKLKVTPKVLIPRPETEELVYWIVEDYKSKSSKALKILDIGTGSGCIPIVLKKNLSMSKIRAIDKQVDALAIAKENARIFNTEIRFFETDILDEKSWKSFGNFDIIVSNPPYIPKQESEQMLPQVLAYEPHQALFVENEHPLIFYQKISAFALEKLNPDGHLYFELNEFNSAEVKALLQSAGFSKIELRKDLSGKPRMIRAGF